MPGFIILWIIVAIILGLFLSALILKLCSRIVGVDTSFGRALLITFLVLLSTLVLGGILGVVAAKVSPDFLHSQVKPAILGIVLEFFGLSFIFKALQKSPWGKSFGVATARLFFSLLLVFAVAIPLRKYGLEAFRIPSSSMAPTLKPGDHIFVKKYAHHPARGEIVIFQRPGERGIVYISRVVGLPAENLEIHDGAVWVNGAKLDDFPGVHGVTNVTNPDGKAAFHLGADEYFMLGDDRENSFDSRIYGAVPSQNIMGTYWITWAHFNLPSTRAAKPQ